MIKLFIPAGIKSMDKVFDILEKANIKCSSITRSGITVDASDEKNNETIVKLMETAEEYTLK